jgi:hypothetical protein
MRRRRLFGSTCCVALSIAFAVLPASAQHETPSTLPTAGQAKPADASTDPQVRAIPDEGMISLRRDKMAFDLEYSNATRRRVLQTLAAETGAVVEWRSEADAAERISGRHQGTFDEIVDQVLVGKSFIAAYEPTEQGSRIVQLMIQGKAGAQAVSPPQSDGSAEPDTGLDAGSCGGFEGAVTANAGHGEMLLDNGSILYAGGIEDCTGSYSQDAALFDAVTSESRPTGKMSVGRSNFPMIKLPDGDVLAFGGESLSGISEATDRIERYSVASGQWTVEAYLAQAKSGIATCALKDGSILLVGGTDRIAGGSPDATRAAEIYTPTSKSVSKLATPTELEHSGAVRTLLLQDGRCLIASEGANLEIYDPASQTFAALDVPTEIRGGLANLAQLGLLPDGNVLLVASKSMTLNVDKNEYRPIP